MNYYALLPLTSAIVNVFLWTFVFALHNRNRSKRIYLWFIAHCALWGFSDFLAWSHTNASVQYYILRVSTLTWIPITTLYMYFAYLLIRRKTDWLLRVQGAVTLIFVILGLFTPLVVAGIEQRAWGAVTRPGTLYYLSIICCAVLPGIFSIYFISARARRSTGIVKAQLYFFLSGIALTWTLVLLVNVVSLIWIPQYDIPKLGSTIACLQAIVVFVASTRYRFLNVGVQEVAMDIFSKASDGVLLLDYNGRIIEINDAAQKMLGLSAGQTLSTHISQLIPPPYRFEKNCDNLEIEFHNRHIEDMRLGLLSQCDFYQGNIWAGKLITIKNITVRKAAEQAERVQAILREKVRKNQEMKMLALGELAGEIVHNVNNLMSAIVGYTSLLRRKLKSNTELHPLLDGIQKTVENASNMGKELLRFTQTSDSPTETIDVHESIRNGIRLATHSFNDSIQFQLALDATDSMVLASGSDLENIILNLCINAKDAMSDGGTIFISTTNIGNDAAESQYLNSPFDRSSTRLLCLQVKDTGCGIDPSIIDRVFEPFFTTKKRQGGTGLGLSNTFGIIRKIGGNISVSSPREGGTTFTIVLPVLSATPHREPS